MVSTKIFSSTTVFNIEHKISTWNDWNEWNESGMISKGLCDTVDWSNDAENLA